jgi:hypothetical protein
MFGGTPMRLLLRTVLTPIAALVLLAAGVSFAVATGSYHPPKPAEDVYPCVPDHIGEHGGKDDKGYKSRKVAGKARKARKATGKATRGRHSSRMLTRYYKTGSSGGSHSGNDDDCKPECPKASSSSYKTTSGGSHSGNDDCKPECPKASSTSYKTTSGGSHSGSGGNDDCKPECPKASSSSYKTTTSGGSHSGGGNDDCKPDCESSASKKSLKTSTTSGGSNGNKDCTPGCESSASKKSLKTTTTSSGSHGNDNCKDEKPGCGPDKTNGVAGNSGQHTGQPPKADNRQDCPNPPGQQVVVVKKK